LLELAALLWRRLKFVAEAPVHTLNLARRPLSIKEPRP
jgi:hypothetical protein